jgi:demethylmenaquinone methyltransferase/2-methoxy-6-polyprenyl-1,4-benzoquinol methylase
MSKPQVTAQKPETVQKMFGEIAGSYDQFNGLMTLNQHQSWRKAALQAIGVRDGDRHLDLCCGTGDFLKAATDQAKITESVGIDFSAPMLEQARPKAPHAQLLEGDVHTVPFENGRFSIVTVGWGLRNTARPKDVMKEAARVLEKGGRFAILETAEPGKGITGALTRWTFHTIVPIIGRIFGKGEAYSYLPESTSRFMPREEVLQAMRDAGFADARHRDLFFGNIALYWGAKS